MSISSIDAVLTRLETCLNTSNKSNKLNNARLDDATLDALFELDRILSNDNIISHLTRGTQQSQLLKLIVDKVLRRSGETLLTRNLVCSCLVRLVEANTGCMQLVHHECMALLQHKEQSPRLAGLAVLSCLVNQFGLQFLTNPSEIINILIKLSKRDECVCKELVLQGIGAIYVGTLGGRAVDQTSASECLKIVARFADRSSEKSLRILSAKCMEQIINSSTDGREVDMLMPIAIKALLDPDIEVRITNARSMGTILYQTQLKDAARAADLKGRRRLAYDVRSINDALELIAKLFAKAPGSTLRTSLSVAVTQLMQQGCKECDDTTVSGYVMSLIGLVFKPRGTDSEREGRQLAACLSDAIHKGILDQRSERGLEVIIKSVVSALKHTAETELNEFQIVVACECLSTCFIRLGESLDGLELKDSALDALLSLLSSPLEVLRIHAAECLRVLARSCHSHIATWLSVIEKMIGIVWSDLLEGRGRSADESAALDPWHSLHGHVSALTAVVGVIVECERGVSISMIESIFSIARKFVNQGSSEEQVVYASQYCTTAKIQECGWLLLAALIGLGPEFINPRLNLLFGMWRGVLGRQPPSTAHVHDIVNDLIVRAAALTSLRSYMHVMRHRMVLTTGSSLAQSMSPVLKACRVFLATNLSLVKALASAKDLDPVIIQALQAIKPPLYDCFAAVPPACYTSFFSRLLKLIVAEFSSQPTLSANTEIYRLLNPSDACLQWPQSADLSLLHFADLQTDSESNIGNQSELFNDYGLEPRCAGGSIQCNYMFDWFVRPDSHTLARINAEENNGEHASSGMMSDIFVVSQLSDGTNRNHHVSHSHSNNSDLLGTHAPECYQNNATRSVNAAVRLFSCLFADQSPAYKEQLMKHLLALVQKSRASQVITSAGSPVLDSPAILNIATCLLGVCRDQCLRQSAVNAQQAVHLMLSIAVDLLSSTNVSIQRAAGESIGLIVQFEDEEPAAGQTAAITQSMLVKVMSVLRQQTASKDQNVLCGAVFALGCVHRYGGGLKTVRELTLSVASLHAIARDFTDPLRMYCLHALWLIVDSGGLSFASAAQPTLAMLWAHSIHDVDQRAHIVTFVISRIIVSVIAALGPDVNPLLSSPGTNTALGVERFANIEQHLMGSDNELVQSALIEAQNERVLFNAVPNYGKLVSMLTNGLSGTVKSANNQPAVQLRRSSAKCVLRWGEKDARVIHEHRFDRLLLSAIDVELDPSTRALLEHALRSLIVLHGTKNAEYTMPQVIDSSSNPAPFTKPVRWYLFESLKQVVGSTSNQGANNLTGQHVAEPGADDEDESIVTNIQSSTSAITDTPLSGQVADFRWQTKSFALSCLCLLLRECRSSLPTTEFDLFHARKHRRYPYEYVIDQLVDLLTVACSATSAVSDCVRLAGVNMTITIVECYAAVMDPDSEVGARKTATQAHTNEVSDGEPLLSLYAAQINSALSSALKNRSESIGSAPGIRLKGCSLAVALLSSAVVHDPVVVQRFVKQILLPLQKPNEVAVWYAQYDGNAVTSVLLAHLAAIGQLQIACVQTYITVGNQTVKKKKHNRVSTRVQAMQAIEEALTPHNVFIQQHLICALKDFACLLITSRKDLVRARGTFFDGSTATRVVESFGPYWHTILEAATSNQIYNSALFLRKPSTPQESTLVGESGADSLICLAVASSHLLTSFSSEINGLNRNKNDTSSDTEQTERGEQQILTCLNTVTSIARMCSQQHADPQQNSVGIEVFRSHLDVIIEVVLVIQWSLQHRLNEDQSVINARQRRAVEALNQVIRAILLAESFRSCGSIELTFTILDCLFVCLCQHSSSMHELAAYVTSQLLETLPLIVQFAFETFLNLGDGSSDQSSEVNYSLILNMCLSRCQQLYTHSSVEIIQAASESFIRCIDLMFSYSRKLPTLALDSLIIHQAQQALKDFELNGDSELDLENEASYISQQDVAAVRFHALLQTVWKLAVCVPPPHSGEADLLTRASQSYLNHELLSQLISSLDAALRAKVEPNFNTALRFINHTLCQSIQSPNNVTANFTSSTLVILTDVTSSLIQLVVHDSQNNERVLHIGESLLIICRAVPESVRVSLLSLIIPVVINVLHRCPALLPQITEFASTDHVTFKQVIAALPDVSKLALQNAVFNQQKENTETPSTSSVTKTKKKKHRVESKHDDVLRSDTIELKTDFASFSKL